MDYKSHIDFKLYAAFKSWAGKASRYGMVTPITNKLCESESEVLAAVHQLICMRRLRMQQLLDAGWRDMIAGASGKSTEHRKNWQYAYNCPPSGVVTNCQTRRCSKRNVCPFCWDREILQECYRRLEWAFYEGRRGSALTHHLVEMVCSRIDEVASTGSYARFAGTKSLFLQDLLGGASTYGTAVLRSVEPMPGEENKSKIIVRDRFAVIVRADVDTQSSLEIPNCEVRIRRHEEINREVLAFAAARVCRYPVGMMTGSAHAAALILKMRNEGNQRWFRTTGTVRQEKARRETMLAMASGLD